MPSPLRFVAFSVDDLALALPIEKVERVLPAIGLSPLPNAPKAVSGIINLRGRVIPVFDLRKRLGLAHREMLLNDKMIIATQGGRTVALLADGVQGLCECAIGDVSSPGELLPGLDQVAGVIKGPDGMTIIHDLGRFLSIEEERELEAALSAGGQNG